MFPHDDLLLEPMTRFELVTSSLPRKRSTPELHRLFIVTMPIKIYEKTVYRNSFCERMVTHSITTFALLRFKAGDHALQRDNIPL